MINNLNKVCPSRNFSAIVSNSVQIDVWPFYCCQEVFWMCVFFCLKIMKENFPTQAKKLDMQVQEAQTIPKKLDARRNTPRHIIITLPKIKDEESILKAAREITLSVCTSCLFVCLLF